MGLDAGMQWKTGDLDLGLQHPEAAVDAVPLQTSLGPAPDRV